MFKLLLSFTAWLFGLDRWKKRLLQITFDVALTPIALLLAFLMRLETTAYLYRLDTYIGVLIAIIATLTVFATRGLYNNFVFFFNGCTLFYSWLRPKHRQRTSGKCCNLWSRCRRHPTDVGIAKEPELSRQVLYRRQP